ncbi:MAG TPA: hypothetical protein VL242_13805, partial [Sorangium sp.]|nr:hypothetical protein [Sorangium sp.]
RRWHVNSDDLSFKSFRGLHELHEGFSPANGEQVRDQLVCNGSRQFEPGAGFQPVSYLNSTGAPVKARVVGVAYTKNTTAANIQLKATLGAI